MREHRKEGWWWPIEAHKPHYFRDGRSLCGKWGVFRGDFDGQEHPANVCCTTCYRKLAAEAAKPAADRKQ